MTKIYVVKSGRYETEIDSIWSSKEKAEKYLATKAALSKAFEVLKSDPCTYMPNYGYGENYHHPEEWDVDDEENSLDFVPKSVKGWACITSFDTEEYESFDSMDTDSKPVKAGTVFLPSIEERPPVFLAPVDSDFHVEVDAFTNFSFSIHALSFVSQDHAKELAMKRWEQLQTDLLSTPAGTFLTHLYRISAWEQKVNVDNLVDFVHDNIDELLATEQYSSVDTIMKEMAFPDLDPQIPLAVLSVTKAMEIHLPNRPAFFQRVEKYLMFKMTTDEVTVALKGLA